MPRGNEINLDNNEYNNETYNFEILYKHFINLNKCEDNNYSHDRRYRPLPNQRELMRRVEARLPSDGAENIGRGAVILSSSADGNGKYDFQTGLEHYQEALRLRKYLEGNLVKRIMGKLASQSSIIINDATREHLQNVIQDSDVASIYLLGHGTYHSTMLTDGSVNWYQAGMMVGDHQKSGVFANLGCGIKLGREPIPLGKYVVSANGVLIGKNDYFATVDEMSHLGNYDLLAA
jgi:hypothetical protein